MAYASQWDSVSGAAQRDKQLSEQAYDKELQRENTLTEHLNQVSAKEEIHVTTKDRRITEFEQQTLAITEAGGPQINFLNFERLKQQPMRAENATDYL